MALQKRLQKKLKSLGLQHQHAAVLDESIDENHSSLHSVEMANIGPMQDM